jgi:hypothetical protein
MTVWDAVSSFDFFFPDVDADVIGDKSMSADDSKSANFDDFLRIRPDLDTSILFLLIKNISNFFENFDTNFWKQRFKEELITSKTA